MLIYNDISYLQKIWVLRFYNQETHYLKFYTKGPGVFAEPKVNINLSFELLSLPCGLSLSSDFQILHKYFSWT